MKKTILYVLIVVMLIMLAGCPTLFNPFDLPDDPLIANEGEPFTLDLTKYTDAVNINEVIYEVTSGVGTTEDKEYVWDKPKFNEETDGVEKVTVEANNNRGRVVSDTFTIIVNRPPSTPTLIEPADGAYVTDNPLKLSWESTDQDVEEGFDDYLKFDVYFGNDKDDLPLVENSIMATSTNIHNLSEGMYYWKVVAKDRNSEVESNEIWEFEYGTATLTNINVYVDREGDNYGEKVKVFINGEMKGETEDTFETETKPSTASLIASFNSNKCSFSHWVVNDEYKSQISNTGDTEIEIYVNEHDLYATATFLLNTYNISVDASPSEGGEVSGAGIYKYGEEVMLVATPNTGYYFKFWTENETVQSTKSTFPTFDATKNRILTAHFSKKVFSLDATVARGKGNIDVIPEKSKYEYGERVTLVATPNATDGYQFEKWDINGIEETSPSTEIVVTSDVNAKAYFDLKEVEITITASPANGGETIGGSTYDYGEEVTVVATPNEGYEFSSWTDLVDDTVLSSNATYTFTATEDKHLIANFDKKTYILTIDKKGKGETEPATGTYGEEKEAPWPETLIATPTGDYEFKHWKLSTGETIEATTTEIEINEDITATAIFRLPEVEITASASPSEGGIVSGDGSYELGSDVTIVATSNENWAFTGWYEDDDLVNTNTSFTFNATKNRDFIAYFRSTKLTIDSTPLSGIPILVNGKEVMTPYSTSVNSGDSIEVTASPTLMLNLFNEDEIKLAHFNDDDDASLTFVDWSDGIKFKVRSFNDDPGSYTINYEVEYLMKTCTYFATVYIDKEATDIHFPQNGWYSHGATEVLAVPGNTYITGDKEETVEFKKWEIWEINNKEIVEIVDPPPIVIRQIYFDGPKFIMATYSSCAAH